MIGIGTRIGIAASAASAEPTNRVEVRAELLDAAAVDRLAPEWQALSLAVARPSCFAAPAYFRAWIQTLADNVEPGLVVARRQGQLLGVMPVMRAAVRRGPLCAPRHDFSPSDRVLLGPGKLRPFRLRQLSPIVSMPACWTAPAPLCHDEDRGEVIAAMARQLVGLGGWDTLAIPVEAGAEQEAWLAALRHRGLRPWVLDLGRRIGGIERLEPLATILARCNRMFRKNFRKAQRAAETEGLMVTVHSGRQAVIPLLPVLETIAGQSWKQEGRVDAELTIPYSGTQQRFFQTLLCDDGTYGEVEPVLTLATQGDQPVAAALSLRHGAGLTGLLLFRTEHLPQTSPGLQCVAQTIDWACTNGITRYDLNTTHEWARHLIDVSREQNVVICFAPTLRGRIFAAISAMARRLK